jgi:hypothetical protein
MNTIETYLPIDIMYYITTFIKDEYWFSIKKNNILILTHSNKYIIENLDKLCENTDHSCLKSWGKYNKICMNDLYKKCSYFTFHTIINNMYDLFTIDFIEYLTNSNTLHYISVTYYNLFKKIYKKLSLTDYEKKGFYSLFWDFCNFYYMKFHKIEIYNNNSIIC